jgi:hypothetical protein
VAAPLPRLRRTQASNVHELTEINLPEVSLILGYVTMGYNSILTLLNLPLLARTSVGTELNVSPTAIRTHPWIGPHHYTCPLVALTSCNSPASIDPAYLLTATVASQVSMYILSPSLLLTAM